MTSPAPCPDMDLHHVAYLVADTQAAAAAWTGLGAAVTEWRRPLDSQRAFITFLDPGTGAPLIELVEPYADNAEMQRRLRRDSEASVLYHQGYTTTDFDGRFRAMRKGGWLPLTLPFEGMAPGLRASHLYNPAVGIVEIMEVAA